MKMGAAGAAWKTEREEAAGYCGAPRVRGRAGLAITKGV